MSRLSQIIFSRKKVASNAIEKERKKATSDVAIKNIQARKTEEKITQIAKNVTILFSTKTVFPFDLFPDKITVYTTKIDIVQREFFFSSDSISIPVKNILSIELQTAPFFGTVKILTEMVSLPNITIRFIKKSDAVRMKKIIDALLLAIKEDIDPLEIDPKKFLSQLGLGYNDKPF